MEKKNIAQKLLAIKKQVDYLQKDGKGYQYAYVTPSQVLSKINPLLNEQGVILLQEVVEMTTERVPSKPKYHELSKYEAGKKVVDFILGETFETMFTIKMKFTWVNSDNPDDKIVIDWASAGINGDEKGFGSALTYAERYFLLRQFNIPTDSDDPDSFQDKHLSPTEKKEKEEKEKEKLEKELQEKRSAIVVLINEAKTNEELLAIKKENKHLYDEAIVKLAKSKYEELNPAPTTNPANPPKSDSGPASEPKSEAKGVEPPKKDPPKSKREIEKEEANFQGMKKAHEPIEESKEEPVILFAIEGVDVDSEIKALSRFTNASELVLHARKTKASLEKSGVSEDDLKRFMDSCNARSQELKNKK